MKTQPCTRRVPGSLLGVYPVGTVFCISLRRAAERNAACLTGPSPTLREPIIDLDFVQWPAMLVTVASAWLVGSQSKLRRRIGFWSFLSSNLLWLVWGWSSAAWALVVLQVALAVINIRGARKNEPHGNAAASAHPEESSA